MQEKRLVIHKNAAKHATFKLKAKSSLFILKKHLASL
jgi:hypothetical protein